MKSTTLTVAAAAMVISVQSAHAREHHHGHRHFHSPVTSHGTFVGERSAPNELFAFAGTNIPSNAIAYRGRDQARPAAWCGWQMRHLVHQTNTWHAKLHGKKFFLAAKRAPAPHESTRRFRLSGLAIIIGEAFLC